MTHVVEVIQPRGILRGFRLACAAMLMAASVAEAGPTVRQAEIRINWLDSVRCEADVALRVETDAPASVDHRVLVYEDARIDAVTVDRGTTEPGSVREIGRTLSIPVRLPRPGTFSYSIRYRAIHPQSWAYRCPLWVPTIATDGVPTGVHIVVTLPSDATRAASSLPAFTWTAPTIGDARLGHLPALVYARFTRPGEPVVWATTFDAARMMDLLTIVGLAGASLGWLWRRRR
jgi:hypothetical protein